MGSRFQSVQENALILAGRRLSEDLKPEELPGRILEQLAIVAPYERGSLMLEEGSGLRIAAQRGFPDDERVQRLHMPIRPGDIYTQIKASEQVLMIEDVTQSPGWTQVEWLPVNLSWLGIPLFAKNRVIGMVSLTRRERAAFAPEDVVMASAFAMQASVALENAALYTEIQRVNQHLEELVAQRTEELRKALHALERMDRNKSDFIRVAAHELRTPLTVMMGYVGILSGDAAVKSSPMLPKVVDGFVKGTERLQEIINSMLDLARIENQTLDLRPGMLAVSSLVKRVQADFEGYFKERKQTLVVERLEALPMIYGDVNLLLKVIQNLLLNAIKYTPDGGLIRVAGGVVEDAQLGQCVEIQVQDSGIGIEPEHQELIFEKLYSTGKVELHSSGKISFKGGGPGLGLAIARGIVEAHHGRIWAESPGCNEITCPGSTFHILLPVGAKI